MIKFLSESYDKYKVTIECEQHADCEMLVENFRNFLSAISYHPLTVQKAFMESVDEHEFAFEPSKDECEKVEPDEKKETLGATGWVDVYGY